MQQNVNRHYRFEASEKLWKEFNNFTNSLKKEMQESHNSYIYLDKDGKSKNISDRKMLEFFFNLDISYPNDTEKNSWLDVLYMYKDAPSLGDENGTCANIKVGIEQLITDHYLS